MNIFSSSSSAQCFFMRDFVFSVKQKLIMILKFIVCDMLNNYVVHRPVTGHLNIYHRYQDVCRDIHIIYCQNSKLFIIDYRKCCLSLVTLFYTKFTFYILNNVNLSQSRQLVHVTFSYLFHVSSIVYYNSSRSR